MKCYGIVEIDLTDPAWASDYIENVTAMIERRGGRYLARTAQVERLEGERDLSQVFTIIEFPSREIAEEFYESEEYRPYRDARQAGAKTELLMVAGEDMTGTARIAD
jgi:uncharacterized protein (DUF1330 family)